MALNQAEPQTSRITQTMTQGSMALHISARVGSSSCGSSERGGRVSAKSSRVRRAGDSQSSFGCQTRRKAMRQAIEISEAPMSTIQGLM